MRRRIILASLGLLAGCGMSGASGQRYVVFFTPWSAEIDDEAGGAIAGAADVARKSPAGRVRVTGFADPEGSPQANRDLSALRAQVVVDALIKGGVAAERIDRRAAGSVGYTMNSVESRRVEVTVEGAN